MKFDIAAKIVLPSQRAWVVHAGRSRVNYRSFVDNNLVFLEMPYLFLEPVALRTKNGLRQAIRRSIAFRKHHETTGSNEPSSILDTYPSGVFEEDDLRTVAGSITRLYGTAKVGDLIIVPGNETIDGLTRSIVRFGEISSPFDPAVTYSGSRQSTQRVPVREVKWLTTVPRRDLSIEIERKIGKPPAVREIKISKDTEEILKYAYSSYIYEGNSSSLVRATRYDGNDFVVLNNSSELIAFLIAAHAVITRNPDNISPVRDVKDFTKKHFRESAVENIEIDFSSPGHWRIIGASASLAAFVALGIAVFTADINLANLAGGIEVTNSIAPSDPMANSLEDSMNLLLRSIDHLEMKKISDEASEAKKAIGLESPTKAYR